MGSRFFNLLSVAFILFLSIGSISVTAQTQRVDELRVVYSPERTRLVFDVSENIAFNTFELSEPRRLVVDFNKTDLKSALPKLEADNQHIAAIRTGRPSPNTLRFVFELKKELTTESFVLTPNELYGHRVVVDLTDNNSVAGNKDDKVSTPTVGNNVSPAVPEVVKESVQAPQQLSLIHI